jgi:hypothetical protein
LQYPIEALRHLESCRAAVSGEKALLLGICLLLRGQPGEALAPLVAAVADSTLRVRAESYLAEIAGAPADVLMAMGALDPVAASANFLDRTYLARIFGADSPEVARVLLAATSWVRDPKTLLESQPVGGRLFAGSLRDASQETTLSRAMSTDSTDDPLKATRIIHRTDTVTTPVAQLHPQTSVDVGGAIVEGTEIQTASMAVAKSNTTPSDESPTKSHPFADGEVAPLASPTITPTDIGPILPQGDGKGGEA